MQQLFLLVCFALVVSCYGSVLESELQELTQYCCAHTCNGDRLTQLNDILSVYKLSGPSNSDLVKKAENILGGCKCPRDAHAPNAQTARITPPKPHAVPSVSITCTPNTFQVNTYANISCHVIYYNLPLDGFRTFQNQLFWSNKSYYQNGSNEATGSQLGSSGSYDVAYNLWVFVSGYYNASTWISIDGFGTIYASYLLIGSSGNATGTTGSYNSTTSSFSTSARVTTGAFATGGSNFSTTGFPVNISTTGLPYNGSTTWFPYNVTTSSSSRVTTGVPASSGTTGRFNVSTTGNFNFSTTGSFNSTSGGSTTGGGSSYLYIFCPPSVLITNSGFNVSCTVSFGGLSNGAYRFNNILSYPYPSNSSLSCSQCNTSAVFAKPDGYYVATFFAISVFTQGYYTVHSTLWFGNRSLSNYALIYASSSYPNATTGSGFTTSTVSTTASGSTTGGLPNNGTISLYCPWSVSYPSQFSCTVSVYSDIPVWYLYDYASPYLVGNNTYAFPNGSSYYYLVSTFNTYGLVSYNGYVVVQIFAAFYHYTSFGGYSAFNVTVFNVPSSNNTNSTSGGYSTTGGNSGSSTGGYSGNSTGGYSTSSYSTGTTGYPSNNTGYVQVSCPYNVPSSDSYVLCSVYAYSSAGVQYIGAFGEPLYCAYNCEEYASNYYQYTKYVYFYGLNAGQTSVITGYFYDGNGNYFSANTTVYVYYSGNSTNSTTGGGSTGYTTGSTTGYSSGISTYLYCPSQVTAGAPFNCTVITDARGIAVYYASTTYKGSYTACTNCEMYPYPCSYGYCSYQVTIYTSSYSQGTYAISTTAYDYSYNNYTSNYQYIYVSPAQNNSQINLVSFDAPSVVYTGSNGAVKFNVNMHVTSTYGLASAILYYKSDTQYLNPSYLNFPYPSPTVYFSMTVENNQTVVNPGVYCPIVILRDTQGNRQVFYNETCLNVVSVNCDAGFYISNGTECFPCPQGFYSSSPNSYTCDACPAGYTSTCLSASRGCIECPAGSSSKEGTCVKCAPGTYTSFPGQAYCTACWAGSYANQTGSFGCSYCPSGTFSNAGAGTCTQCPGGTFSSLGAEICTPCEDGYYSYPGSYYCSECPANTYAVSPASYCTPCPSGTQSPPGSFTCFSSK